MCFCCPADIQAERIDMELPACRKMAAPRKVGILTFEHKTGGSLTIGDAETLLEMTRNDRRKDHRFLSTRNK